MADSWRSDSDGLPPVANRRVKQPDRRRSPRGGRRVTDLPGRCPTVVVAEGYPSARAAITRYLKAFGFEVVEALSGAELLDLMSSARPAVIIADTRLPGLHDNECLTDRMSESRRDLRMPIIVTRSAPHDLAPAAAFDAPTADLAKPFNLSAMLAAVRRALRVSR